jgi:hypothetical protein
VGGVGADRIGADRIGADRIGALLGQNRLHCALYTTSNPEGVVENRSRVRLSNTETWKVCFAFILTALLSPFQW